MHEVDRDLRVNDLPNEGVERLEKLRLIFTRDSLDVLHEVGELEANEIDARVTRDPLYNLN